MNSLYTPEIGHLSDYAERLRRYSNADLEDIYYNIHVLQCGARYQMLLREMERRGIRPRTGHDAAPADIGEALRHVPALAHRPRLRRAILVLIGAALAASLGYALLVPIWVFVVIWDFVGIQTWPVYLGIAVGGSLAALSLARDWVGPCCPKCALLAGLAVGVLVFTLSGMAGAVLAALTAPRTSGGGALLGF